jgi:DNA-binding transcriptional ArsR family regulator
MKEKEMERLLKALANRRRLAIVQYIRKNKEASVGEIASAIRLSLKATSKHLSVLARADMLEREQKSVQGYYRISSDVPDIAKKILDAL